MSQQSKQILTNIAADLCSCLTNFSNITDQHLPDINRYVYLPDWIQYKHINSLSRALGKVISTRDRSAKILLTSGRVVTQNCNDIVSCQLNDNSMISLNILDFPLYERPQESELQQNESQFSLNIPNLTVDHISHGKELELHVTPALHIDSETEDEGEPSDFSESNDFSPMVEVLTGDQNQPLRCSMCNRLHTLKYLEMFE